MEKLLTEYKAVKLDLVKKLLFILNKQKHFYFRQLKYKHCSNVHKIDEKQLTTTNPYISQGTDGRQLIN